MSNNLKEEGAPEVSNNESARTKEAEQLSASTLPRERQPHNISKTLPFPIDAQRFLDRIAEDGSFAFQTFSDRKNGDGSDPLARQLFGTVAQHRAQLKLL